MDIIYLIFAQRKENSKGFHCFFFLTFNFFRRIVARSHGVEGGYYEIKKLRSGDLWRYPKWIPNKLRKT